MLQYRYALPYEPWMADARLNVQRDECGCGESTLMNVEYAFDKVTLERMLVPYVVTPYLSYVEPMVEEINGNMIVNVKDSRVAIGKDMAAKIMV